MAALSDGRHIPPPHADERAMLDAYLDLHRATLETKCAGLVDAQARQAPVPPSTMTLLGLVQHAAQVERNWFDSVLGGRPRSRVFPWTELGWELDAGHGLDEALATWRAEVAAARQAAAAVPLEQQCAVGPQWAARIGTDTVSLRWILLHLIEEYARHNGHADLLRECVDGVTGL